MIEDAGGALKLDVRPGVQAFGDGDLIASAVANLVDNAIKYGASVKPETAGEVLLTAKAAQESGPESAWGVQITVQDQGPGPMRKRWKNDHAFYRAESDRQGYGLGLASVLAIVQCTVESSVSRMQIPV